VDIADFALTAKNWLLEPLDVTAGDLDGDRDVDTDDLSITADRWLRDCGNDPGNNACEQLARKDRQRTYLSLSLNLALISRQMALSRI